MLLRFKSGVAVGAGWLVEALAPTACIGCGRYGSWMCAVCEGRVVKIRQQRCVGCHILREDGKTCEACRRKGWVIDGVVAVTSFDQELMREVVHAVKYRGLSAASFWLGGKLKGTLPGWIDDDYKITAVPMHWFREWQRGFNQADLLARGLARTAALRYERILIKKRSSISQVGIGRHRRLANMEGVFAARHSVTGARIVLVDDVVTTGATLNAAAKALKEAGAKRVWGIVLARR